MGNSDLKKYGKSRCSYHDGFLGHWEDDADRLKEKQTSLSPFLFEIEHKWKDVLDKELLVHTAEKLFVSFTVFHFIKKKLHSINCAHRG